MLPSVPSPLRAPMPAWTVERALARALQANPDVQVALAGVERQDGLRLQSLSNLFPRVGVSASLDSRAKTLIDRSAEEEQRINAGGALTSIARRGYDARLEVRQTLFDGLSSWHQIRRLALLEKKASIDARELFLRTASQVRQAFDAVLLRQMIVVARGEAVTDLTRLAEVAEKRLGVGGISSLERGRALAILHSAKAELAQAEAEAARAEELLCRILYIDRPPEGLRLEGNLGALSYRDSFEIALSRGRAGRLDLRAAYLQLEAAKLAQRVAAAGFLPRIEAVAGYTFRSSYFDAHRELEGWTLGFVGRWDLFSSGQTVGEMRVQRAERRIAEIRVADAQKTIGSQIRELFSALEQWKTVMAAHITARDLSAQSKREILAAYDAGRASQEQVLNAEIAYQQASIGWLNAVFNNNTTVYQLDYASANEAFLDALAPASR